jgi:hypothetical protein
MSCQERSKPLPHQTIKKTYSTPCVRYHTASLFGPIFLLSMTADFFPDLRVDKRAEDIFDIFVKLGRK